MPTKSRHDIVTQREVSLRGVSCALRLEPLELGYTPFCFDI